MSSYRNQNSELTVDDWLDKQRESSPDSYYVELGKKSWPLKGTLDARDYNDKSGGCTTICVSSIGNQEEVEQQFSSKSSFEMRLSNSITLLFGVEELKSGYPSQGQMMVIIQPTGVKISGQYYEVRTNQAQNEEFPEPNLTAPAAIVVQF